ncbi:hypothetical protein IQ06DRAFT_363629, partial [Phaeosphaeriaceae sp. SRC1lsM3a]
FCSTQPCSCISSSPVPQTTPCGCKLAQLGQLYSAKGSWTNGRPCWQFSLSVFRGSACFRSHRIEVPVRLVCSTAYSGKLRAVIAVGCLTVARRSLQRGVTGDILKVVALEKQSSVRAMRKKAQRMSNARGDGPCFTAQTRASPDLRINRDSIGGVVHAYSWPRRAVTGPLNARPESLWIDFLGRQHKGDGPTGASEDRSNHSPSVLSHH